MCSNNKNNWFLREEGRCFDQSNNEMTRKLKECNSSFFRQMRHKLYSLCLETAVNRRDVLLVRG